MPMSKDTKGFTPLFYVVQTNQNPDVLKVFLDEGADPNAKDRNGNPLLFHAVNLTAAQKGAELIRVLGNAGADPSLPNSLNVLLLRYAVGIKTEAPLVEALLDIGADPEIVYPGKLRVIHYAILGKSTPDVIRALGKKANLNVQDKNKQTPLFYALKEKSSLEVIRALLESGADPNIANYMGVSPMCIAETKYLEAEAILAKHGGKCD